MQNYDTPKTYIEDDELGYAPFAYNLAKIIKNAKPVDNSCVIGLCGKWGDGKTTFINFVKQFLLFDSKKIINLNNDEYECSIKKISENSCNNEIFKEKEFLNEKAQAFSMVLILLFISYILVQYGYLIEINWQLILYISYFIVFFLSIPKINKEIIKMLNQFKNLINNLYIQSYKEKNTDIDIINFNPWFYRNNEDIMKNFLILLSNKIDLCYKNNVNLLLQYACCICNISIPNIDCSSVDLITLKDSIKQKLTEQKKKYLVIIDDLDRIDNEDIKSVFKAIKLLADFPNIVYLLSYDKEKIQDNNENYIQKIIQLEKTLPVLAKSKLKEIFVGKVLKICETNNIELDKNILADYFEVSLYHCFNNLRDIKCFENSFNLNILNYINIIKEINIYDLLMISIIEEFDKPLYRLIFKNKNLFFEEHYDTSIKNHYNFVKIAHKHKCFEIFKTLFVNYFYNLNSIIFALRKDSNNKISYISTDDIDNVFNVSEINSISELCHENYRRIYYEKSFDNYFLSEITNSLLTDEEYSNLTKNLCNISQFNKYFNDIFDINQDKFDDFIEHLKRDDEFISQKNNIENLIVAILSINDNLIIKLFNMNDFVNNVLSIIKLYKTLSLYEFTQILINEFSSSNVVQQTYYYREITYRDADQAFKRDNFKPDNRNQLKSLIDESNITESVDNEKLIGILIKLQDCELHPKNIEILKQKILSNHKNLIKLLDKYNHMTDYQYYFDFTDIQNDLIQHYFYCLHAPSTDIHEFERNILINTLDLNLSNLLFNQNIIIKLSRSCNNAYGSIKYFPVNNRNAQANSIMHIKSFIEHDNIFTFLENLSDNELVTKYVLFKVLKDTQLSNLFSNMFNTSYRTLESINKLNSESDELNIDNTAIKTNMELCEKYKKLINEIDNI